MFVERSILNGIRPLLEDERILLFLGARQVGKTTLLRKIRDGVEGVSFFVSFEDPRILAAVNGNPEQIFDFIPKPVAGRQFLFLDEIQYLDDPSNFLKYIYDLYGDRIKLIATGSSAFYIDKKFKDSLAGRKRIIPLHPFSFKEFLLAKKREDLAEVLFESAPAFDLLRKRALLVPDRDELYPLLDEYICFGGYPAVVLESDLKEKEVRLQELFHSLLKKDFNEAGIRNEAAFYALLRMVAAQAGSTVSAHELANTIGVSLTAVKNYFHVLQKANIIGECRPFSRNVRKELTKKPKIYFRDSGYRNVVLDCFRPISNRIDAGETLENVFYGECVKAGIARIQFWRTQGGNEIDFVLNEHSAFELKMNPAKFSRKKVRSFLEAYPEIPLSVVTARSDKELDLLDFV